MGTSNKFTIFQPQQPTTVSFKDLCGKKLLSDEYSLFCAVLEGIRNLTTVFNSEFIITSVKDKVFNSICYKFQHKINGQNTY